MASIRLGINIDHVATVRNARGGLHPDPTQAALLAQRSGADGITAHLREDRRHITDQDIKNISQAIDIPLNFEMAMTSEMREISLSIQPNAVCIVPERREERTTEGGLDVLKYEKNLAEYIKPLQDQNIRISLFIAPNPQHIDVCASLGVDIVEIHTGAYCHAHERLDYDASDQELEHIFDAMTRAQAQGLEVHAGHGLSYETVPALARHKSIKELNIGHFLMGEAMFVGLEVAIKNMRQVIDVAAQG